MNLLELAAIEGARPAVAVAVAMMIAMVHFMDLMVFLVFRSLINTCHCVTVTVAVYEARVPIKEAKYVF